MPPTSDSLASRLAPVARARREQAPVRGFVALVFAVAFIWRLNTPALWLWLGGYVAAQAFEIWALRPFLAPDARPSRLRTGLALGSIFVLAGAFGSMALVLLLAPGQVGPAAGVLLLCSGLLNVLALSRGSSEAFVAGAAPYVLLAAVMAGVLSPTMFGHDPSASVLLLATVVFGVAAGLMWRDGERTYRRERAVLHELDRRRAEAEAAWEERRRFVAAVSHELRTPLGAITAASGAMEAAAPTAGDRSSAALIGGASRLMRRLLDDLLDLAKLEAGRMTVEAEAFDLRALVSDGVALWTAPAHDKGLALELDGAEALPAWVVGDALRVRQVLDNLLSNAVKFTAAGEVRVAVAVAAARRDACELEISVADTGAGLSDEVLAHLFEPFAQAGPSTARLHGGSGLGLAVSRELARVMGGSLAARRGARGKGAVFTLSLKLPVLAAPEPQPRLEAEPAEIPGEVLVVDDHALGRRALRLLLEAGGSRVSEAASGAEALDTLAARPFDLVLMDVTMPGLDGRETTRRLRAGLGPNARTPVLGVTGLCGDGEVDACLAAGMDGHLEKPCQPAELYDAMLAALHARPRLERAA